MVQSYLLCVQGACGQGRPLGRQSGPGKQQDRVLVLQMQYLPGVGNLAATLVWESLPES